LTINISRIKNGQRESCGNEKMTVRLLQSNTDIEEESSTGTISKLTLSVSAANIVLELKIKRRARIFQA